MFYLPVITQFHLGFLTLQVWGVLAASGVVAALSLSLYRAKQEHIGSDVIWDAVTIALLGMLAGGRIFYVFSLPDRSLADLIGIEGGFSLLGGMLLGGVLVVIYLVRQRLDVWMILDLLTPGFMLALVFTRLGCLFVDDHVGKVTNLPWGKVFQDGTIRHPVILYEIIFLTVLFFRMIKTEKKPARRGEVFICFALCYAAFRTVFDFFRCDDLDMCDTRFYSLTLSQWICLCILICVAIIVKDRRGGCIPGK